MTFIVDTKTGRAFNWARGDCPKCHGSGINMSEWEEIRDGAAYRLTAKFCDCVQVTAPRTRE